jgi:hypothetical protein
MLDMTCFFEIVCVTLCFIANLQCLEKLFNQGICKYLMRGCAMFLADPGAFEY